jgi:hypothetical protein
MLVSSQDTSSPSRISCSTRRICGYTSLTADVSSRQGALHRAGTRRALLVIKQDEMTKVDLNLDYFDAGRAKKLKAEPGDWCSPSPTRSRSPPATRH